MGVRITLKALLKGILYSTREIGMIIMAALIVTGVVIGLYPDAFGIYESILHILLIIGGIAFGAIYIFWKSKFGK